MASVTLTRCLKQLCSTSLKHSTTGAATIILKFKTIVHQQTSGFSIIAPSALTLSHKIFGQTPFDKDNPPIIILHDVFGSKNHWDNIGSIINDVSNIPVVTVDLRNHGNSPHAPSHNYMDMANDLLQLYKNLGIERANLLGHSMGGRTAMCLALSSPWKVSSLLVEDVSPISVSKIFMKEIPVIYNALSSIDFSELKTDLNNTSNLIKARTIAKEHLKSIIKDNVTLYYILSEITPDIEGTIHWAYNLQTLRNNINEINSFPKELCKKVYTGPTLFIAGDRSDFVPYGDLEQIKKMFPAVEIKYVSCAGHNVHVDNPKKFLEHAINFFKYKQFETVKE